MADAFDMAWDTTPAAGSSDSFDAAWDATPEPAIDHLGNIWQGIKAAPSAAYDTVANIPSGIGNIISSLFSPRESIADGTTEKTLRSVGALSSGFAGAGPGALAGATLGSVVPVVGTAAGGIVGGALGAAGGMTLFDYVNELFGNDAPTTTAEKIAKFEQNTGTGLAFGTLAKGTQSVVSKLANLDEAANALDRKSIGTRQSDYGRSGSTQTIETPEVGVETFTKNALDDLLTNNKLGASRDPGVMLKVVDAKSKALATEIDSVIRAYDEAGVPADVSFNNARAYISNKVPAAKVDSYLAKLNDIEKATIEKGQGSLEFLQQQKIAYGTSYNPKADSIDAGFTKALYHDFKQSIEAAVPEVKGLNAELQKYIVAEPIISRSLTVKENASPATKMRDLGFTTGGIGATTLTGSVLGGPVGTAIGGSLALGIRGAASPTGQALLARGVRGVSRGASPVSDLFNRAPINAGQAAIIAQGSQEKESPGQTRQNVNKPMPSGNNTADRTSDLVDLFSKPAVTKKDIAAVERAIDSDPYDAAVYEMESSRNPKAKNPNSSASGAFQLISATQKSLGVKNPFDIADNYRGFLKLKKEHVDRFGDDPRILYAAHFLGATTLSKFLKGETLTEKQAAQVKELEKIALPRFMKIYSRISGGGVEV